MYEFKILELFSGIGGMHYAFKYSGESGKVVAAIDINPVANNVYEHNYPDIKIFNNNIQKLTPKFVKKLEANTILMSPPCQPFTRVGNQKDIEDNRTDALKHICDILQELETIDYILMENVKGFEKSIARNLYLKSLKESGFNYRELILSPSHFGIPNTRHRYFCLAKRKNDFNFENCLWQNLPPTIILKDNFKSNIIKDFLEETCDEMQEILLSDEILKKRILLLDIVTPDSTNSICFTKAYTHYCEGTGSVYSSLSKHEIAEIFEHIKSLDKNSDEYLIMVKKLRLRYFTAKEVARLMNFPEDFQFPINTTNRQKYRLLGNSINVLVVGELIKILCS